ncbi:hypothetical protein E2C01_055887 [Portunus trituberculatus]|uniref:Uncharacterized protein n=1 Tax=Portunus trituberculatus TaxID=210409 RepID=A0A5B7GNP0_PORTR|nr:hypothetical protein [Portunus trituberculatus]
MATIFFSVIFKPENAECEEEVGKETVLAQPAGCGSWVPGGAGTLRAALTIFKSVCVLGGRVRSPDGNMAW